MTKKIPIHGRAGIVAYALVDQKDFDDVKIHRWNLQKGYAKRTSKRIAMHREILGLTNGKIDVDHLNHDRLDNRRKNLRICTRSQNCQNSWKRKKNCTSKFLGVCRKDGVWYVQISVNFKKISGGYFRNQIDAAIRYDELAIKHFGSMAKTNFNRRSRYQHHRGDKIRETI